MWWLPEGVGFERVSGKWLRHWKGACASLERIDGSHHCSTGFFGGVCARVERQHRSVLPSAASPASSCMVTACCMPVNSPVSVVCCLREHSVPRHRPGASPRAIAQEPVLNLPRPVRDQTLPSSLAHGAKMYATLMSERVHSGIPTGSDPIVVLAGRHMGQGTASMDSH